MGKILSKSNSNPSETNSPGELALTPDLLAHPLFLRSDDNLLSTLINCLKAGVQTIPDTADLRIQGSRFDQSLSKTIHDGRSSQDLANDFKKVDASNTTMCWKAISQNELYFRCLDCEVIQDPSLISLMCQDCFHKSKHDGHRILKGKPSGTYTCDCGRPDNLREEGFCPNHKHKDQTIEEALADFPKIIRSQVTETFKKVIYGIVCLCEIKEKAKDERAKAFIGSLAQSIMGKMLGFYTFLTVKVARSFNLVLERILQSSFEDPNNLVWHDCKDLKDENQVKNSNSGQPTQCTCTMLGCLLRFSKYFSEAQQETLNSTLIESCKEKPSTRFLNRELVRHVYFIVGDPLASSGDFKKKNSRQAELFGRLDLEEGDMEYLDHFLGALRRILSDFSDANSDKYMELLCIQEPLSKFLSEDSKTSLKVLQENNLFPKLLDLLSIYQANMLQPQTIKLEVFEHMIDYGFFSITLAAERYMCASIDHGLKKVGDLETERKDPLFRDVAKAWCTYYQNTKLKLDHERFYKGRTSFLAGLERILCLMLVHYLNNDVSQEIVEGFLRKMFPDMYPSILACNAVSGVLVTLGLIRFTDIIKSAATRNVNGYYYNMLGIFETDIVLIQLMTIILNPEDIFSLFVRNFFSYSPEIQEFCLSFGPMETIITHPHSRKMILLLEDFLNFFVFLMNDEICFVNLNVRKTLGRKVNDSTKERAIKKLLINTLMQRNWIDIGPIKAIFNLFVFEEAQDLADHVISKISMKDEKTYRVKLNKEYENDVDLYVFYKHYNGQREERNRLTKGEGKNDACDMISGTFYTDLPEYLVALQHNIFQSQLPDFISNILANFSKEISHLVQPALKLSLFNLQVMLRWLNKPSYTTEGLQKKVEANYLNKNFIATLNGIQAHADFKECEACIKNIKALIKQLSSKLLLNQPFLEESLAEETKENLIEQKKRLAKEKMEKMKEDFAKKQALFAEKNESLIAKATDSPDHIKQDPTSPEKTELVCQYCLDQIQEHSSEEYGVPIYVEFTDNFYNTEEKVIFKEKDYSDLSKVQWWPVISSCNHFYHKRCFEMHFQNSRGPQNQSAQLFMNEYETQCALCKTLCNNFLLLNGNEQGKERDTEQYSLEFALKIQNLLVHLGENLLVFNPNKAQDKKFEISIEEIFKRGYEYLIESFHLFEKPHLLEGNFRLYVNLFRAFKWCPQTDDKFFLENKSLIQILVEKYDQKINEKVYLESIVQKIFFNLLQEKPVATQSEPLMNEHLKVIEEYILVSIVNITQLETSENVKTLEDVVLLYKEDKDFRNKIFSELSFPLQKMLLAYNFNRNIVNPKKDSEISDICKTICSSSVDTEKIDLLLQQSRIPLTFEQIIEASLSLIHTLSQVEKDLLNSLLASPNSIATVLKQKLAPRFIELPRTFLDFSQKYTPKKCSACKKHSVHLVQNTCLICEEHLCGFTCSDSNRGEPGNLSQHANKYHMGLGLFYGVDHHAFTAIKYNVGLVFVVGNSYADEQGRPFRFLLSQNDYDTIGVKRDLDFKRFVLDDKVTEAVKKVMTQNSIGKEIFEKAAQNPSGYTNKYTF